MDKRNWKTFSDPRFEFKFKFPDPTLTGYPVEQQERLIGRALRIHLTSKGSGELYFEVTRYPNLRAMERYLELKAGSQARPDELWVGALTETQVAARPASKFEFRWRGIERLVLLVQQGPDLYQLLYDPHAPLNSQVLSTVEFLPEQE
jgi:hypothetical protein